MHTCRTLDELAQFNWGNQPFSACAIGMFDGIHAGHQVVLQHALRRARINNLTPAVFTFANHPQSLLNETPTPLLSSLEERLAIFERLGFELALVLDFTPDLKNLSAHDFVRQILLDGLHVKSVSVGYDHRFGKGRQGDGEFLTDEGQAHGFDVAIIEPVTLDNQIISSTLIRKLLTYGELDKANALLGRPYTLSGKVIHGHHRGQRIGFPTANVQLDPDRLVPALGVYAGWAQWGLEQEVIPMVCNIGLSPTFGDILQPQLEVHVLDRTLELYDKPLRVFFTHRIRKEQRFDSIDALTAQIKTDCQTAREWLEDGPVASMDLVQWKPPASLCS